MDDLKKAGKYVSMLLRHHPEEAGVVLDEHGAEFKEYGLSKRWIRTSWDSARGGFQPKYVKKAFEMLQMPYYAPEKTQK